MCFTKVHHQPKCTANIALDVDVSPQKGPDALEEETKRISVGCRKATCMEQSICAFGCFWMVLVSIACSHKFAGQMEYVGITQDTGWCT